MILRSLWGPCEIFRCLLHKFLMGFSKDTIFVRDNLIRCDAFLGRYMFCVLAVMLVWPLWDVLMRVHAFLAADISLWWWDVRKLERLMLKDAGDCGYTMVYWTLRGFVCISWVVRWRGINVNGVVVGESRSALGDRKVCVEVVWFLWPAWIASSRYVTWTCSCDARRFSLGFGLVKWCM